MVSNSKNFNKLARKIIGHFVLVALIPLFLSSFVTLYTIGNLETNSTDLVYLQYLLRLKVLSVGTSLITFLLITLVAYQTAGFIVKRLYALKMAADEISKGNINYRLSPSTEDDLAEIYNSFNLMSGFIGDSQNSLNITVERLERALIKEKELSELKTRFISLVSHQIRTPISALRWSLEMLKENLNKSASNIQLIDTSYSNLLIINTILDDLLLSLDIESQTFELNKQEVNIATVINSIVKDLESAAKAKKIKIDQNFEIDKDLQLNLDESKFAKILDNILMNAIDFSPEDSRVHILVKDDFDKITISIIDSGIGIPNKDQEHIGEKFFRASNATIEKPSGSGLGLYIAKKLIEACGGKLEFTSTEKHGSTFSFSVSKNHDKI